jgi:hypothetical protein
METAIILEGFQNFVAMHNLKYTKIIGDGDNNNNNNNCLFVLIYKIVFTHVPKRKKN